MPRKKNQQPLLHDRVADMLAAQIQSSSDPLLPTISALANQFHVGKLTMWRALGLLRKRRLVEKGWGTRSTIVRMQNQTASAASQHGAASRLAQQIRDAIADGTYRVGDVLPKSDYFVLTAHVSTNTLTAALTALASEGHISRRGKKWVVGKTNVSLKKKYIGDLSPVVLSLIPSYRFMSGTYGAISHFARFIETFSAETQRFGVHVQVAAMHRSKILPSAPGTRDSQNIVAPLGKRYRGTLVASILPDDVPLVNNQTRMLTRFKEPVILFDNANRVARDFASAAQWPRVHRMFQDETRPAQLAFSTLAGLGHSKIAVADHVNVTHDWSQKRASAIQQFARQRRPHIEILPLHHRESCWLSNMYIYPEEFVKHHFNQSASLLSLLKRGVTALIAPNDSFARKYYALLTAAGVSVPKDVSLISFDNDSYSWLYPISTIDLGFSALGYRAAHIFLGDIPVGAGKNNAIQSEPFLIDRGSLAPA